MARLAGWFTGMVAVGAFAVAEIPAQGDGGMPSRVPQDRPVPGLSWNEDIRYGQLLDSRDGHLYRVVKIGNRTWMAQNLNYSGMDKKLGSCGQGVDEDCIPCGRLYSWKEVMGEGADSTRRTVQGICPDGWRVPSDTEWTALQEHVEASGTFDGTRLKSQKGWKSGGSGSDLHGFRALPCGFRNPTGGILNQGTFGYWWTSTEKNASYAWFRYVNNYQANVFRSNTFKASGYSLRCIQGDGP